MNSDYEKRALIDTNIVEWQETETKNVFQKVLSIKDKEETAFIQLKKGAILSQKDKVNSVEILVLEGIYVNEYGEHSAGTYLKFSEENEAAVKSDEGCVIFRKMNFFTDDLKVIVDTNNEAWLQGQGKLEVIPLSDQTALVKWPKGERFVPHKHWGGEEVVVLKGVFMDEYGAYPKGSWIRSPHLSEHFPYVEEETIIFVKTGHM